MAITQSDIDALTKAITNGVLDVRYGENRVVYRSIDVLIRARNDAQAQLDAASITRNSRCSVAAYSRD
jgi:hypothetical protein